MSRFEKRNTLRALEIMGKEYSVDFGRDEIPLIFQRVGEETAKVAAKTRKDSTPEAVYKAVLKEQKGVFQKAIADILGNTTAGKEIFKEDNTAIFHSDVYLFLIEEYKKVMEESALYSPARIEA